MEMAKTAPIVTSAVESHSTPMSNPTGRGFCITIAGATVQDSKAGSARRNAADARSIAAISRSSWARSAAATKLEASTLGCVTTGPASGSRISSRAV